MKNGSFVDVFPIRKTFISIAMLACRSVRVGDSPLKSTTFLHPKLGDPDQTRLAEVSCQTTQMKVTKETCLKPIGYCAPGMLVLQWLMLGCWLYSSINGWMVSQTCPSFPNRSCILKTFSGWQRMRSGDSWPMIGAYGILRQAACYK